MARPARGSSARPGVRAQLAAAFRAHAARTLWRHGPDYWRGLADRLEAGQPVEVRGYLLGDLLSPGVDPHATVRVESDGSLTVVHADARARVRARYAGLSLGADQ